MGAGRGSVMPIGLAFAGVVMLSGCSGLVFVANNLSQGITEFEAMPNEGSAPLDVRFGWRKTAASEPDCEIAIDGRSVASMPCGDERHEYTFTEPGAYEVVLRNTTYGGSDDALVVVLPAADAAETGLWVRTRPIHNPEDRPQWRELNPGIPDRAGSFVECAVADDSIDYGYRSSYRERDVSELSFTWAFEPPPRSAAPGATVELDHAMVVSGTMKGQADSMNGSGRLTADLRDVPGGRIGMSGFAVANPDLSTEAAETASVTFPTDGDRFVVEAVFIGVTNFGGPSAGPLGCDIRWLYELRRAPTPGE